MFAQREIEFAGAVLSSDGYKMQPKIYEAIEKFPFPSNLTEMRAFYGMANQLTPFNENLSKALSPLRPLLKKDAKFFVDEERKQALKKSKQILSSDKTLAFYCQGRPLRLFTDASNIYGLGCVLQQMQSDGTWRPNSSGFKVIIGRRNSISSYRVRTSMCRVGTKNMPHVSAGK